MLNGLAQYLQKFPGAGDESRLQIWTLRGILLYALILQGTGIWIMFPHPDEMMPVRCAFRMLSDGWNPGWFGWPGQSLIAMLAILYGILFLAGNRMGIFADWAAFVSYYQNQPQLFYFLGRCITILFSAGAVALTYRIARRFLETRYALAASFFLASSWLFGMESKFVRPDILSIFFVLLCVHFALNLLEGRSSSYYVGAGIALGLAVATKWVMAPVLLAILVAHLRREWQVQQDISGNFRAEADYVNRWAPKVWVLALLFGLVGLAIGWAASPDRVSSLLIRLKVSPDGNVNPGTLSLIAKLRLLSLFAGIGFSMSAVVCKFFPTLGKAGAIFLSPNLLIRAVLVSLLCFFLIAPYVFFDMATVVSDLQIEARTEQLGAERLPGVQNLAWYFIEPLGWGYGYVFQILALIGVMTGISRRNIWFHVLVFIYPAIYLLIISLASLRWARWAVHLIPVFTIYSALGLSFLVDKLQNMKKRHKYSLKYILPVICLVLSSGQIWRFVLYDRLIMLPDTRTMSVDWIMKNISSDKRIAMDALAGDIPAGRLTVLRELAYPSLSHRPLSDYLKEGWEIYVVSGGMYERYFAERERYPAQVKFYEQLFSEGKLLKEFKPDSGVWPPPSVRLSRYHIHASPEIRVYEMTPAGGKHPGVPMP